MMFASMAGNTATIAALRAETIPSPNITYVEGYATENDGGQGFFLYDPSDTTSSDNGGTIIVDAAGHRWKRAYTQIFPQMFGAKGDGVTDDTTPFQAAINYCKTSAINLYLLTCSYLVKLSLDCTFTTGNPGFRIIGQGKRKSFILHQFPISEAYPVVDMCGNTRGGLTDLTIQPSGTSYATCARLAAKAGAGNGQGNGQEDQRCGLYAGNVAGDACAVYYNSDLARVIDCEGNGSGGGIAVGVGKPANIASKYVSLLPQADWTQGYIERCEFTSVAAPAFMWMGGAIVSVENTYFALTGTGSSKIIEVTGAGSGNAIFARAMRTENQSSATGVAALCATASMQQCDIVASLETDSLGHMITTAATGAAIATSRFKVIGSGGALLNIGDGGLQACTFEGLCGAAGVGACTATGLANSWGVEFRGGFNATQAIALFGGTFGLRVSQGGLTYRSLADEAFVPVGANIAGHGRANVLNSISQTTAYTGGTGAQTTYTTTARISAAAGWSSQLPASSMKLRLFATFNSIDATGNITLQLVQGLNTATLLSWTNPGTGALAFEADIDILSTGGNNLRAYTAGRMGSAVLVQRANLQGLGVTAASDATLNLIVTSTTNVAASEIFYLEDV